MPLRYTTSGPIALNGTGTIFDGSKKWCIQGAWTGVDVLCFTVSGIPGVTHASFDGAQADGSDAATFACTKWSFDFGGSLMIARLYSGSPCNGGSFVGNATGIGPLIIEVTEAAGTYSATGKVTIGSSPSTIFSASGAFGTLTSGGASLVLSC